jgi:hypothetical protein
MSTGTRRHLTVLTALRLGRALLLTDGWTQKHYAQLVEVKDDGQTVCKRCAYGALEGWTIDGNGHYDTTIAANSEAMKYLKRAMYSVDNTSGFVSYQESYKEDWEAIGVAQWNDVEGRTAEQVIAAFDKAIELAEAEGYTE